MHKGRSEALEDITLVSGCIKLVLASPYTSSGETAAYATQVVSKRDSSVGFCWLAQLTLNLGQDQLSQQMVLFSGPGST